MLSTTVINSKTKIDRNQ